MTANLRVIGVDPGPTPGIVVLEFIEGGLHRRDVIQCTSVVGVDIVDWLIRTTTPSFGLMVQVEKFVVGNRSSRSSSAGAGQATRDLIGELKRVTSGQCALVTQTASRVKAWATDERLEAAGLLEPTKGMRHARDAARHALFCAVHDGGIPDPLSKKWSA